ncbi:MAG: hypothetical protein IT249_14605 [Chitinophagaceae bacterium]|nr:hypothetical protein [Chitinophagaceae bacterium]
MSLCYYSQIYREDYVNKSKLGDSYQFVELSAVIDALSTMYISTGTSEYLNDEIVIINNVIGTAAVSKLIPGNIYTKKDDYLGWISKTVDANYNDEASLYEGYFFRYVLQTLFDLKKTGWINKSTENYNWYQNTLQFIEKNVWEKWIDRSMRVYFVPYMRFMGARTHTASHWAYIAIMLEKLTSDAEIKKQANEVYTMFDTLLKRNLKPNSAHPDAYVWNSTWDDVSGTDGIASSEDAIQDVSHGNHVLSYIAATKRIGNTNWSDAEILSFCNTIIKVIYNKETNAFAGNVDGTIIPATPEKGTYQCDGWLKLSEFNEDVRSIYTTFAILKPNYIRSYDMELQYYANLLYYERK